MGKEAIEGLVTVIVSIVGVAILAVLVSRNANTAGVITSGGSALATALSSAEAPVTQSGSGNTLGWTGAAPVDYGTL